MAMAQTKPNSIAEQRRQAITGLLDQVRRIERTEGVNRDSLEKIRTLLVGLTRRKDLFDDAAFPPPNEAKPNIIYLLSEDPDRRFALYLSCGMPGKNVWPHDHTTWACIAGMGGAEHNRIYERHDSATPGVGTVKEVRSITLTDGVGVAFMPDDVHSIHSLGTEPTRHFHLYGTSLENLPDRLAWNTEEGTYRNMPANPNITDMRPFVAQD